MSHVNIGEVKSVEVNDILGCVELKGDTGNVIAFHPGDKSHEILKAMRLASSKQIVYRATRTNSSERKLHKRKDCHHLDRARNYTAKPIEAFTGKNFEKCSVCW